MSWVILSNPKSDLLQWSPAQCKCRAQWITLCYDVFAWSVALLFLMGIILLSDWGSRLISWNIDSSTHVAGWKSSVAPRHRWINIELGAGNVNIQCMCSELMGIWVTLASWKGSQIMPCLWMIGLGKKLDFVVGKYSGGLNESEDAYIHSVVVWVSVWV